MDYAEDGVIPEFDGVLAAVWPFVADKIERDNEKYERIREQRTNAINARWEKERAKATGEYESIQPYTDVYEDVRNIPTATVTPSVTATVTGTGTGAGASTTSAKAPPPPKATKHKHGEYNNVLLTDEELDKLKAEYPGDWQARINKLSEYIASTGKAYKSHYATLRSWARRDKEEARKPRPGYYIDNPCSHITPEDHEKDSENPF